MVKDPEILYSMVNMKLRDCYDSFEDYCQGEDVDGTEIEVILGSAGHRHKNEIKQLR